MIKNECSKKLFFMIFWGCFGFCIFPQNDLLDFFGDFVFSFSPLRDRTFVNFCRIQIGENLGNFYVSSTIRVRFMTGFWKNDGASLLLRNHYFLEVATRIYSFRNAYFKFLQQEVSRFGHFGGSLGVRSRWDDNDVVVLVVVSK